MENKENLKENIKEPVSKKPDTNYKTLFLTQGHVLLKYSAAVKGQIPIWISS